MGEDVRVRAPRIAAHRDHEILRLAYDGNEAVWIARCGECSGRLAHIGKVDQRTVVGNEMSILAQILLELARWNSSMIEQVLLDVAFSPAGILYCPGQYRTEYQKRTQRRRRHSDRKRQLPSDLLRHPVGDIRHRPFCVLAMDRREHV